MKLLVSVCGVFPIILIALLGAGCSKGETEETMEKGLTAFMQEDYDGATELFSRVIEANSSPAVVANALAHRAACYRERGEYDRAKEDVEHALRIDPDLKFAKHIQSLLEGQPGG